MTQYQEQAFNQYDSGLEGQTLLVQSQAEMDAHGYELSVRNQRNYYEIPIDKARIYLNFTAQKILITDAQLSSIGSIAFTFFVDPPALTPTIFTLVNGQIYRCLDEPLGDLRSYTYFYMDDGVGRRIPNYKTVEVMLAQRQISYAAVKVVETSDCMDIPVGNNMPDLTPQWSSNLGDSTGYSTLSTIAENVQSLQAITSALGSSTAAQQQMVQDDLAAQSAAMQASAAAAQADADAAAAANTSAQVALESAQAQLAAAEAAATQAQAAADNIGN